MNPPKLTYEQSRHIIQEARSRPLLWIEASAIRPPTGVWLFGFWPGSVFVFRAVGVGLKARFQDVAGFGVYVETWAEIPTDLLDQSPAPAASDKPCYYCGQTGGTHAPRCLEVL